MRYLYMNLDDVKGMMEDMGWHVPGPKPQVQKFNKRIKTVPGIDNSSDATFKSMETNIEQIEKNLDDIDRSRSRFMSACDICYPRQYPKQEGYFPRHYPNAKATPLKKKVDPMFQEREKSDAGKLADRFTELLKKK